MNKLDLSATKGKADSLSHAFFISHPCHIYNHTIFISFDQRIHDWFSSIIVSIITTTKYRYCNTLL